MSVPPAPWTPAPSGQPGPTFMGAMQQPKTHLALAIVGLILFCPLGIPALVFSLQVTSKWSQGDRGGSWQASRNAKVLGWVAVAVGVVLAVVFVVFPILAVLSAVYSVPMR